MPFVFHRNKPLPPSTAAPPDKRRRTEGPRGTSQEPPVPVVTDDDWGALDDDLGLTEAQLEELDLMASQATAPTQAPPAPPKPTEPKTNVTVQTKPKPKVQTNAPLFNDKNKFGVNKNNNNNNLNKNVRMTAEKSSDSSINNSEIDRVVAENEQLKSQMAALKETECSKEGEIKMLRQMLKHKESEIFKQKQTQSDVVDQQAKDHLKKLKDLEREVEKLRAQIQFKDQEIVEYSRSVKRLEQSKSEVIVSPGPSVSETVSPKFKRLPPSPKTPSKTFPTPETFIGKKPSPRKVNVSTTVQTEPMEVDSLQKLDKQSTALPVRTKIRSKTDGMLTGPSLVGKIQNETETGVYKLIEMVKNLTVSSVNCRQVAESSLIKLLSDVKISGFPAPLSGCTKESVQLLPLISICIDNFLRVNSGVENTISTKADTSHSSVCLMAALDVLRCLVAYSSDVRDAILSNQDGGLNMGVQSSESMMLDAGASKSTLVQLRSLLEWTISKPENSCAIVNKILDILIKLASQAKNEQLSSFLPFVESTMFTDLLRTYTEKCTVLLLSRLISALVQCNQLLTLLCKRSELCTLHCLYTAVHSNISVQESSVQIINVITAICDELLTIISAVISQHRGGSAFLQETDCSCSEELPKALVLLLHCLVHYYAKLKSRKILRTLKRGLTLIYTLSVRGFSVEHFVDVDLQYTAFVNEMKRIISTDCEASDEDEMVIRYLWDFDDVNEAEME